MEVHQARPSPMTAGFFSSMQGRARSLASSFFGGISDGMRVSWRYQIPSKPEIPPCRALLYP